MRRTILFMLIAVATALPSVAFAQEEDLPKPEQPPEAERRQERRQRLFGLGRSILENLARPEGDPKVEEELDVEKLNKRVQGLVDPLVERDPDIQAFDLRLDPERTNIAKDQFGVTARIGLTRTRWSPDPTLLELRGAVGISGGPPSAEVRLGSTIKTDVISLTNFALSRAKRLPAPDPDEPITDVKRLIRARLVARLKDAEPVHNMDDLADLFSALPAIQFGAHDEVIAGLKADIAAAPDDEARAALYEQLMETRRSRDRLFHNQVRVHRDPQGYAEALSVTMVNTEVTEGAKLETVNVLVTPYQIDIEGQIGVNRWVNFYYVGKPLAMGMVRRFQEGDPLTTGAAGGFLQQGYDIFRGEVIGPGEKVEDADEKPDGEDEGSKKRLEKPGESRKLPQRKP